MKRSHWILVMFAIVFCACTPGKKVSGIAMPTSMDILLADTALTGTHTGIYVYNPTTQKALYSHQSDKFFVPASNTKLFSCYAGMKYLGDSLTGLKYAMIGDTLVQLQPTGDPTFFHDDYKTNPVFNFLKNIKRRFSIDASNWKEEALGSGWAWNDYDELYMAERSPMPILGNATTFIATESKPGAEYSATIQTDALLNITSRSFMDSTKTKVQFKRDFSSNHFSLSGPGKGSTVKASIPFVTNGIESTVQILKAGLFNIEIQPKTNQTSADKHQHPDTTFNRNSAHSTWFSIHSQPTDSLLKPMMHYSDNFFAEQTLLMVSNEKLGYMNDGDIIDTLLKTDLKDLPQKPVWVDGSGLSRYNLFTPEDFVKLLEKMKDEFGIDRMKNILPTGGEGTLSSLYKTITGNIFAKTGTLSGQVALSGYLFAKSSNMLIFSILVNNHTNTATNVRKAIEKFVLDLWERN